MTAEEMIEQTYTMSGWHQTRFIFDTINDWLLDSRFAEVDCVLSSLDVTRLESRAILNFITITTSARHLLPSRGNYCRRACNVITTREGEAEADRTFRHILP